MEQSPKGKVIIITGASDGIGAAAARELKSQGANVVIVGRSPEKTKRVAENLSVPYYLADFTKFDDVRKLAAQIKNNHPRIDVLANNAGGLMGSRMITVDGHETTLQINHLAPFLLTNLLIETLVASRAIVVNTASDANRFGGEIDLEDLEFVNGYTNWAAYGRSKRMNILFTRELDKRFSDKGITTACFHPGIVRTNFSVDSGHIAGFFYKSFLSRILRSPEKGADTLVWLATSEEGKDWKSGEYYSDRKIFKANKQAYDSKVAHDLWEKSAELTGLTR